MAWTKDGTQYTYRPAVRLADGYTIYGDQQRARNLYFLCPSTYKDSYGILRIDNEAATKSYNFKAPLAMWSWAFPSSGVINSNSYELSSGNLTIRANDDGRFYTISNSVEPAYYQEINEGNYDTITHGSGSPGDAYWASSTKWNNNVPKFFMLPVSAWSKKIYSRLSNNVGMRIVFETLMGGCRGQSDTKTFSVRFLINDVSSSAGSGSISALNLEDLNTISYDSDTSAGMYSLQKYIRGVFQMDVRDYSGTSQRNLYVTPTIDWDVTNSSSYYKCGSIAFRVTLIALYN